MGADHVFLYGLDWVESIKDVTGGKGVDVVYESVGQTLMDSFETGGTVVFFGMAGGKPEKIDSRMLIGGDLWNVLTTHEERTREQQCCSNGYCQGKSTSKNRLFFRWKMGRADAHRLLESRKSSGNYY